MAMMPRSPDVIRPLIRTWTRIMPPPEGGSAGGCGRRFRLGSVVGVELLELVLGRRELAGGAAIVGIAEDDQAAAAVGHRLALLEDQRVRRVGRLLAVHVEGLVAVARHALIDVRSEEQT